MKRCPECGESMRLGMGQWLHLGPVVCRIVTLRATPDEIAAHARPAPRPKTARPAGRDIPRRFGYLTPEGPQPPPGR
jgi:hypothetical protein